MLAWESVWRGGRRRGRRGRRRGTAVTSMVTAVALLVAGAAVELGPSAVTVYWNVSVPTKPGAGV